MIIILFMGEGVILWGVIPWLGQHPEGPYRYGKNMKEAFIFFQHREDINIFNWFKCLSMHKKTSDFDYIQNRVPIFVQKAEGVTNKWLVQNLK